MALGAARTDVVRMVVGQGTLLAGVGIAFGLCGAFALTRLLKTMLFGVGVHDPVTFAAVPLVLATVALLAAYLPARRASRLPPLDALRAE